MEERPDATRYRIDQLPLDRPLSGIERRRLVGERAMLSLLRLEAGSAVAPHEHDSEQMAVVLEGRLRFTVGDPGEERTVEAGAGEIVHLPGGVRHGVEVLERARVIDLFAPPAEATGVDSSAGPVGGPNAGSE